MARKIWDSPGDSQPMPLNYWRLALIVVFWPFCLLWLGGYIIADLFKDTFWHRSLGA